MPKPVRQRGAAAPTYRARGLDPKRIETAKQALADKAPATTREDRAALEQAGDVAQGAVSGRDLRLGADPAQLRLQEALGSTVLAWLQEATQAVSGTKRRDAKTAVEALAGLATAPKQAFRMLTGRSHGGGSEDDLAALRAGQVTRQEARTTAESLLSWHRSYRTKLALRGMHPNLKDWLGTALDEVKDRRRLGTLFDGLARICEELADPNLVGDFLATKGAFPSDWRSGVPPGTKHQGLEHLHRECRRVLNGGEVSPIEPANTALVDRWAGRVETSGALQEIGWRHAKELQNQRGFVGEVLRAEQLREELPADREIVRGVTLLRFPSWLDELRSDDDVFAACAERDVDPGRVLALRDERNALQYGLVVTEVDIAVLRREGGKVVPEAFENVKVGLRSAGSARAQNEVVNAEYMHKHVRFLFPLGDGRYREEPMDRSPDAHKQLSFRTVGPRDAAGYHRNLPLNRGEITLLSQRLASD